VDTGSPFVDGRRRASPIRARRPRQLRRIRSAGRKRRERPAGRQRSRCMDFQNRTAASFRRDQKKQPGIFLSLTEDRVCVFFSLFIIFLLFSSLLLHLPLTCSVTPHLFSVTQCTQSLYSSTCTFSLMRLFLSPPCLIHLLPHRCFEFWCAARNATAQSLAIFLEGKKRRMASTVLCAMPRAFEKKGKKGPAGKTRVAICRYGGDAKCCGCE